MNMRLIYSGFGILLINCTTFLSAAIDKSVGNQYIYIAFFNMLISLGLIIIGCMSGE